MEGAAANRLLAGRYVLESPIGSGGMATVWLGRDKVLARPVAIKILREEMAAQPDFLERFRREAVAAARLSHPCIVKVFDTGMDDGICYIVLEHVDGQSLRDIMHRNGPMECPRAVGLVVPVLKALEAAHAEGVIHRDVKPGNVLVCPDGRVKVTDFGIAKAAFTGGDLTATGIVLGTVHYLSPEQVQGTNVDARSDLYSAAAVMYEMLTGRPPFESKTAVAAAMMRLTTDPPPPGAIRGGIPRDIEAVVMKGLARDPDRRFPSAEAMRAALERTRAFGEPTITEGTAPIVGQPLETFRRSSAFRSWMLAPLVVVLVGAALIAGGIALGRLRLGGPLGVRAVPGRGAASPTPASPVKPVPIVSARDFDPLGKDHMENPQEAPLAFDGDPSTVWSTSHYLSASFGGLKQGVGLWVGLGSPTRVTHVTIQSPLPGWTFQLQASSGPPGALSAPLAAGGGSTTFVVGPDGRATVELQPIDTQGLLIWITVLAPAGGRFGYAASIGEVSVSGKPA
jgi:tRNA A-37 threonylcarbamoyl transferase component Bud32